MSALNYAIVWLNHNAAEVFCINAIEESKLVVNSHTSLQSLHHRAHIDGSEHHPVDTNYFARIASALNHVGGTLRGPCGPRPWAKRCQTLQLPARFKSAVA